MKVEFINPFVRSLTKTFSTMLACNVERGALCVRTDIPASFAVSGVIGLSGRAVGTVVVHLTESVARNAASNMLMMEVDSINADVVDAVGEIANMVAGCAKAELEELHMSISLPTVITGEDHEVRFPSNVLPICIPFGTPWGPVALEVGLEMVAEPATC